MNTEKEQKIIETKKKREILNFLQYNVETLNSKLKEYALANPFIDVVMERHFIYLDDGELVNKKVEMTKDDAEPAPFVEEIKETKTTLKTHLLNQIYLFRDTLIRQLMIDIVDELDQSGYLKKSIEKLAKQTNQPKDAVLDALTLVQQLEPAGVGARTLQECLMLQVERDNQAPNVAYLILESAFTELTKHDWLGVADKVHVSVNEVMDVYHYIRQLNPYPGIAFGAQSTVYSRGDVYYNQNNLVFNEDLYPKLVFHKAYYEEMMANEDADLQKYVAEKYAEYQHLQFCLDNRKAMIMTVAQAIIDAQFDYFQKGERIKPLAVYTIANQCHLHETIVSRVINGKYMRTQRGIEALRSFFPSGIN